MWVKNFMKNHYANVSLLQQIKYRFFIKLNLHLAVLTTWSVTAVLSQPCFKTSLPPKEQSPWIVMVKLSGFITLC